APLRAGELQLALGLAPEGDLARRAVAVGVAPVAAAQVREQLEFGVVADARVGTGHLDARLIELHQQPVHRHLENLGKLGNAHFGHRLEPSSRCCQLPASNHGARAVMMSVAALSAASPSMSASSSTDCSASSSMVEKPSCARMVATSSSTSSCFMKFCTSSLDSVSLLTSASDSVITFRSHPVSWLARRMFWPPRPMACESFSSETAMSMLCESSSTT